MRPWPAGRDLVDAHGPRTSRTFSGSARSAVRTTSDERSDPPQNEGCVTTHRRQFNRGKTRGGCNRCCEKDCCHASLVSVELNDWAIHSSREKRIRSSFYCEGYAYQQLLFFDELRVVHAKSLIVDLPVLFEMRPLLSLVLRFLLDFCVIRTGGGIAAAPLVTRDGVDNSI